MSASKIYIYGAQTMGLVTLVTNLYNAVPNLQPKKLNDSTYNSFLFGYVMSSVLISGTKALVYGCAWPITTYVLTRRIQLAYQTNDSGWLLPFLYPGASLLERVDTKYLHWTYV
jgi:hypothetical protein